MTRPDRAFARVARAPGLILALWVGQMLLASLLAYPVRMAGEAAMGPFTWFDDRHRLRALSELLIDEPAVAATVMASVMTSGLFALGFSILVGPAVITRLRGKITLGEAGRVTGRHLGAMTIQTLYSLVVRAVFGAIAAIPLLIGPAGLPIAIVVASVPTLVLDRARTAVVLEGARAYHPRTHLGALVHVLRRPGWIVSGAILDALQLTVGLAALVFVISPAGVAMGGGALWLARLAGLVAIGMGLWRISLAVDAAKPI